MRISKPGAIGQRLYLAAEAFGPAATGIAASTMKRCIATSTSPPSRGKSCTLSRSAIRFPIRVFPYKSAMLGLLVSGNNHFIVQGPLPDADAALALVRHWSIIQIGAATPAHLGQWQIVTRALRETLEWAVIVGGDSEISPAVKQLLDELFARGIPIQDSRFRLQ